MFGFSSLIVFLYVQTAVSLEFEINQFVLDSVMFTKGDNDTLLKVYEFRIRKQNRRTQSIISKVETLQDIIDEFFLGYPFLLLMNNIYNILNE